MTWGTWEITRQGGRRRYIWIYGVLLWGVTTAIPWAVATWYFGTSHESMGSLLGHLATGLLVFPMAGYVVGSLTWRRNEWRYDAERAKQTTAVPEGSVSSSMLLLIALTALCCFTARVAAAEAPARITSVEGVTEYRLTNGLRVLLMPEPSRPLIHVHCTVLVGPRHEGTGEAGMAHLLEHMLCKGTKAHPDIMKALRDRGATANAYTSKDTTRFIETLPASDDNLAFAIRLEADRLVNSVVKREELLTEMTVVRNEFEQAENEPTSLLVERMAHAAFRWHNYGKTILGNRTDIERVPVENLQAFYKKHYRPDNAVLVVTGKFDEAKALALVAEHFGPIPRPEVPLVPTYTREPAQDGERHVTLRRVGAVGAVYHIPAGSHPDYPAVMLLAHCLSNAPGGRLYKALVETKLATNISGDASGYHEPWLIRFHARVDDSAKVDAARDALVATLEAMAEHPIMEEEVDRARKEYAQVYERALTDAGALADQLDFYSGVGDWRLFFWERDRTEKVTAADINRVAAAYLVRNNRTVGVAYPEKQAQRVEVPEAPDTARMLEGYVGRRAVAVAAAFDPTPENIEARATRGTIGSIKTAFLPKPTRGRLVHLDLVLRYGDEASLTHRLGACQLLPNMLLYGSKLRTRQQLEDDLNKLGGGIAVTGVPGQLQVRMLAKKEHLAATLELVHSVLREPTFPPAEFATLKSGMVASLTAAKTDPGSLANVAVLRAIHEYPENNIRHEPTIDGRIERVKAATLDDVKALYTDLIGAGTGELAVVGDFDPAMVKAALEPTLVGWASKTAYVRVAKPATPVAKGRTIRIETPDKANAVYYAALTYPMKDSDPDYSALQVGTYLLGGHTIVGRLGSRVRKEKGLSYGVEADFEADASDPASVFVLAASTNPANMAKLRDVMAAELAAFLADGVTMDELAAAKQAYLMELKVNLAEDGRVASRLRSGLYLGRTMADRAQRMKEIEALTPADVQRACRRVIDPAKLVIAEAGDFAKVDIKEGATPPK